MQQSRFQRAVVRFDAIAGGIGPQVMLSIAFLPIALGGVMLLSVLDDGFSWGAVLPGSILILFGLTFLTLYAANAFQKIKMHKEHDRPSERMKL